MHISALHRINYGVGVINVASPECKMPFVSHMHQARNQTNQKRNEPELKAF